MFLYPWKPQASTCSFLLSRAQAKEVVDTRRFFSILYNVTQFCHLVYRLHHRLFLFSFFSSFLYFCHLLFYLLLLMWFVCTLFGSWRKEKLLIKHRKNPATIYSAPHTQLAHSTPFSKGSLFRIFMNNPSRSSGRF